MSRGIAGIYRPVRKIRRGSAILAIGGTKIRQKGDRGSKILRISLKSAYFSVQNRRGAKKVLVYFCLKIGVFLEIWDRG